MAKYVGKIFKISNNKLGIRNSGAHYVHITWFNPKTKKFRCKIITSLENKLIPKTEEEFKSLDKNVFHYENGTFYIFNKAKYNDVRYGKLTPIPADKLEGFDVWSAYSDIKNFDINFLKKAKACLNMNIKK